MVAASVWRYQKQFRRKNQSIFSKLQSACTCIKSVLHYWYIPGDFQDFPQSLYFSEYLLYITSDLPQLGLEKYSQVFWGITASGKLSKIRRKIPPTKFFFQWMFMPKAATILKQELHHWCTKKVCRIFQDSFGKEFWEFFSSIFKDNNNPSSHIRKYWNYCIFLPPRY